MKITFLTLLLILTILCILVIADEDSLSSDSNTFEHIIEEEEDTVKNTPIAPNDHLEFSIQHPEVDTNIKYPTLLEQVELLHFLNSQKCQHAQKSKFFFTKYDHCLELHAKEYLKELLELNPQYLTTTPTTSDLSSLSDDVILPAYSKQFVVLCGGHQFISFPMLNTDIAQHFAIPDLFKISFAHHIDRFDYEDTQSPFTRWVGLLLWQDNKSIGCVQYGIFTTCLISHRDSGAISMLNYEEYFKSMLKPRTIPWQVCTSQDLLSGGMDAELDTKSFGYSLYDQNINKPVFYTFDSLYRHNMYTAIPSLFFLNEHNRNSSPRKEDANDSNNHEDKLDLPPNIAESNNTPNISRTTPNGEEL